MTAQIPFTGYDIQQCLFDQQRVALLRQAIVRTVKPGDIVIDAGSGTGVLGMLAVNAGAAKVYCIELNYDAFQVLGEHARRNGLADRIVPVYADATEWWPDADVDVIISEVISAGFFYEPQLQILNHLRLFLKPGGTTIPVQMNNYVELLDAQEELYGLLLNYDSRFATLPGDQALTDRILYNTAEFTAHNPDVIATEAYLRVIQSGTANAVRVSYDVTFAPGITATEPTEFLLNPQVIFLPEPVRLQKGQCVQLDLTYDVGSLPRMAQIEVSIS